jgi:hypothetical protein
MKKFAIAWLVASPLIVANFPAAAQSGTCSGSYNTCLQRLKERTRPGQTEAQTNSYRAECVAARDSCMQTGTWSHNTAHITGLQKK